MYSESQDRILTFSDIYGNVNGREGKKKKLPQKGCTEDVMLIGEEFLKKGEMRVDSILSNSPGRSRKMRTEVSVRW